MPIDINFHSKPRRRSSLCLSESINDIFEPSEHHNDSFSKPTRQKRQRSFPCHKSMLSLVGSYEESLLSGRASAPSSQPIPFIAKIGVIPSSTNGKMNNNNYLKYSKHLSISFGAVFYSWKGDSPVSANSISICSDSGITEQSPYVGTVDLQSFYNNQLIKKLQKKSYGNNNNTRKNIKQQPINFDLSQLENSKKHIKFPGFKIPEKGKIQITLSNAEKTAFKLFLIPYDLKDMPVGSKTFIRHLLFREPVQQSHNNIHNNKELGVGKNKCLLQAIHLQICHPRSNKYYLYDNFRIVFQNRIIPLMNLNDSLSSTIPATINHDEGKPIKNEMTEISYKTTTTKLISGEYFKFEWDNTKYTKELIEDYNENLLNNPENSILDPKEDYSSIHRFRDNLKKQKMSLDLTSDVAIIDEEDIEQEQGNHNHNDNDGMKIKSFNNNINNNKAHLSLNKKLNLHGIDPLHDNHGDYRFGFSQSKQLR